MHRTDYDNWISLGERKIYHSIQKYQCWRTTLTGQYIFIIQCIMFKRFACLSEYIIICDHFLTTTGRESHTPKSIKVVTAWERYTLLTSQKCSGPKLVAALMFNIIMQYLTINYLGRSVRRNSQFTDPSSLSSQTLNLHQCTNCFMKDWKLFHVAALQSS